MRTPRLLLIFILCFPALYTAAQTTNNNFKVPEIIPKSPEAASLGRYGEIAVGEYTGAADISVPLHVVKGGKLSFPIALKYNTTGVRVAQEATWVGLGWDLSAIAGITYVPVGGNDQVFITDQPWSDWQTLIDYVNPNKSGLIAQNEDRPIYCDHYSSQMGIDPPILQAMGEGPKDLFSVNCMGLSFKFYIHPATQQPKVFGGKNNYKIEILNGNINIGFKITDNNGVMYYFNQIEYSEIPNPNGSFRIVNAWYVTEIRRPDGDCIKFRYSNFGRIVPLPAQSEQYMAVGSAAIVEGTNFKYRTVQPSTNWVQNQYLTEIETATELVQFSLSSGRSDLYGEGARKLDAITITDKFSARKKSYSFEYGYFDATTFGGNYLNDNQGNKQGSFTDDNLKKRLKLLSVTEKDQNSTNNQKYSFSYNEGNLLPYKTSFAIDHWGFYNGQQNGSASSHTTVPQIFSTFFFDDEGKNKIGSVDPYQGAYRGCNKDYITAGTLKSVTYPTGGRTELTFEPNSFNNSVVLSAAEENNIQDILNDVTTITSWDFNSSPGSYASSFTLSTQTVVNFTGHINNRNNQGGLFNCTQMAGTSIVLFCGSGGFPTTTWTIACGDFDQSGNLNKTWNQQLTLPAGTYALITSLPDNLGFQGYTPLVTASIKYRYFPSEATIRANHIESYGEGLRIKKIENYSGNTLVSSREYKYINEDGTTSGKLMMPLKYTDISNYHRAGITHDWMGVPNCSFYTDPCVVFTSTNSVSVSTSPNNAGVGYSRVEIIDNGVNGDATNGKIIKTFKNEISPGLFFDNILLNGLYSNSSYNGSILNVKYLNNNGNIIREEKFTYENFLYEYDWINVKVKDFHLPSITCECTNEWQSQNPPKRYMIGAYPYANYRSLLTNKTEIDHTQTGNITTQSSFEYNLSNYEISKITTTDSKGEQHVTTIKYADDIQNSNPFYSLLVDANMVSVPLETIKYKGETDQLERLTTNYFFTEDWYLEPISVERQLKAAAPSTLITYSKYAPFGNVREYVAANGIYTSAIWGYNNTLPIAYVENAREYNIFHTGFEEGDGNSGNNDCKTGLKSHTGAYSKQLTGLDNGAYTFSYWLKSGSTWVFNTQTVNVTSGSYTISFVDGQQVDDVRFHPVGSYMKTFTYEPTVGTTSITDVNNRPAYYEYDAFGRLSYIRDKDNNILKKICYNYAGQQESCPLGEGNVVKSGSFAKNNCSAGYGGTSVTYTVPANTYFGAEADALAQNDVNTNGQAYANQNGACALAYYNVAKSGTFTRNNCAAGGTGSAVTYTVAANTYTSIISQADADEKAQNDVNNNGQTYANNNGTCTFYSVAQSGTFTKNNCASGGTGSSVTYNVAASTYSSTISQADADNKAQNDVNTNGQSYANSNGYCTWYNVAKGGNFTKNDCPGGATGVSVTYAVPPGTYSSTISQADADQKAQNDVNANGQNFANTNGVCLWYSVAKSGSFTRNNCASGYTGSTVTYTVSAGTYNSTISQADADQKAQNDVNNNGQTYANNNGACLQPCTITINSGYNDIAHGITNEGTTVSFGFAIFSYGATMYPGTPYVIGTINGGCKPSSQKTLYFTSNGRSCSVVISTSGQMTLNILSGTPVPPYNVVSTPTLTYNL